MRKKPGQPDSVPSSCLSQSSVLAKRLFTTRTRHIPPARASTLHSVAMGGEPPQPSPCPANILGGAPATTAGGATLPGLKFLLTQTGIPSLFSDSLGTYQDEIAVPAAR